MPRKKSEPKKPAHYTDAYYAPDGYRTKQYRAKLEASQRFLQPMADYVFNTFHNRKARRLKAKRQGVFKLGIWGDTVKGLDNKQTFIKEKP